LLLCFLLKIKFLTIEEKRSLWHEMNDFDAEMTVEALYDLLFQQEFLFSLEAKL